jgi:hypothetical protein
MYNEELLLQAKQIASDPDLNHIDWDTKYEIAQVCLEDGDTYEEIVDYILDSRESNEMNYYKIK